MEQPLRVPRVVEAAPVNALFGDGLVWDKRARAGDVGPEELPAKVRKELSTEKVSGFLRENDLVANGEPGTLADRVWHLKDALAKEGFLAQNLGHSQRKHLLQALLAVSDIFYVDKQDLRQAAMAEEMTINTGEHKPVKQRAFKLA